MVRFILQRTTCSLWYLESFEKKDDARKYIFIQISCCNGDNNQRDSFVTVHTLISYCKLLKINLIYSYLYCLSISFEEKKNKWKKTAEKNEHLKMQFRNTKGNNLICKDTDKGLV